MKKTIVLLLVFLLLCGCSAPQAQETEAGITPEQTDKAGDSIPPFEREEREILPLPDLQDGLEDPIAFVDTLIEKYDVKHLETFDADFEIEDIAVEEATDGFIFKGQIAPYDVGVMIINQPLNEYFNAPENGYAVLIRFKSDDIYRLRFSLGGIKLDFTDGIYPAIDISGDDYGDPMIYDNWNDFIYEPGEWAYVFLAVTKAGEKSCYIWPEKDASNFNYLITYDDVFIDYEPEFIIELSEESETVTISDIWLFSFEEIKI